MQGAFDFITGLTFLLILLSPAVLAVNCLRKKRYY